MLHKFHRIFLKITQVNEVVAGVPDAPCPLRSWMAYGLIGPLFTNKKLCYRRWTTRRDMSVNILSTARNKLYNKSATNRSNGVRGLQLTDL